MAALEPHFTFGVRADVKNNLCFIDEQTVVFPCGNSCVCYNTVDRSQRIITGRENSLGAHALAISSNRRYLAVSERGDRPAITVYDLQQEHGRKRKVLGAGDAVGEEFVCLAFSPNSKYLIGQMGGPEWELMFWLWEKQKVLALVKTSNPSNPVTQVSFNPYDNMQICVSGPGVLKLFCYEDGALKQSSFPKMESVNFLCHTWMTKQRLITGTDTGRLLVFESGDLRREINVTANSVHEQSDRHLEVKKARDADMEESPTVPRITAVLSYCRGFACSAAPDTICLFENINGDSYMKTKEIQIPSDPYSSKQMSADCQEVETICMSPAENTLCISTNRGQLYSFNLTTEDNEKEEPMYFDFLCQSFHSKPITGLSVCSHKPLVATSSVDCSVRIWNYQTQVLELYKEFHEEAHSVAFHPTGLFILVGFSDKLRLMNLLIDNIRTIKEFTVRGSHECAFSHGGHLFAAVSGNIIHIYSFTTFENTLNLKGHIGKVRAIDWTLDDSRLVSCGMDGAVYVWNTLTGKRESENVLKSCSYTSVSFSSECKTILAVGTDFTLKEIQDSQILREVPADEVAHTAIVVSHSGRVIFTGTSAGTVRAIKYPLPIKKEWIMYQAHCSPVTKMVITCDEQFLVTVSEGSCLMIWKIINKEGHGLKSNKQIVYNEEVLITKSDLEEKNQTMLKQKIRLEEMEMEHEYLLSLKDVDYKKKIKDISDKYIQEIESLKMAQQTMKMEMERQQEEHEETCSDVAEKHSKQLQDLESSYSQKLIVEYDRCLDLQHKCQSMQDDYETQLQAAQDSKRGALEELTQLYEAKLQAKQNLLTQCEEKTRQQGQELEEKAKELEEDEGRLINDIQMKYERKLHSEKEINTNLKNEAGFMSQKIYSLQQQIDDRYTEISQVKQERQRLLGLVRSMEGDIEDLKRQISGHEKTNQDKDKTISSLKNKMQELEKLKFLIDFQLNNLTKTVEPLQSDIGEKKEKLQKLEEEVLKFHKDNCQQNLTISDLRQKLDIRNKEMQKEKQKVKDLETYVQRFKSDLHSCVGFIQDPKKLKDSVQTLNTRYVSQTDVVVKSRTDEDVYDAFCRQREHLEKTITHLKIKMAKADADHEKNYVKIMKENISLITEINQLRLDLLSAKSQATDSKAKLAMSKKSKKSTKPRPNSEDSTKKVSASEDTG